VLLAGSPPKASPTNAACPATKETPLDAPSTTADTISLVIILLMIAGSCVLVVPAVRAVINSGRARKALARGDLVETRVAADRAKIQCWYTFGFGIAIVILGATAVMLWASDGGIRRPFLKFSIMSGKFGTIGDAFLRNVKIFLWTEPFVLVWGLIVAIARLAPGKPGRPVRALATFYVDLFRGVPAVIVIYLLGFGLVTSKLPVVSKLTPDQYAILALTLTYGAYVAEVYRAGIESIHWSQTAAARSLGLSNPATLRHVVVPQAVRRIVPPLLNDFIGLQKDTALVGYIGVLEAFNQSRIINSQVANLSALTVVALLFYVITVPQARMVDWLVRRDQSRMRAGG
jgi:polar amino acid transport system permease protein